MLAWRYAILLLLGATVVCFALSVVTGDVRWRRRGLVILKWTVAAGLVFFGVLIVEQLGQ